jgi:hypothetical protein
MPAVTRWLSTLAAFAVVAVILGIVAVLDTRDQRALANDYLANGVHASADDVVVDVHTGRGGDYIETVEVTFGSSRVTLAESRGDPEGNGVGEHRPNAGTRYAAPLVVLHKPDAPGEAMALVDAEELAAAPSVPAFSAGAIALGGTVLVGLAGLWLISFRRAQPVRHRRAG